jgi:hypothetical protein
MSDWSYKFDGLLNASANVIGVVANVVMLPFILEHLGPSTFGLWMLLTSYVSLLSISEAGVSLHLQTRLTRAYGRRNDARAVILLYAGLVIVTLFTAFFLMAFSAYAYSRTGADHFRVISSGSAQEFRVVAYAVIVVAYVSMIGSMAYRALIASGQNNYAAIGAILSRLLQLLFVGAGLVVDAGVLYFIFAAGAVNPVISVTQVLWTGRITIPRVYKQSLATRILRQVSLTLSRSPRAFGAVGAIAITNASAITVAGARFGTDAVAALSIAYRAISVVVSAISQYLVPMARRVTLHSGDLSNVEIVGLFRWLRRITIASAIASIVALMCMHYYGGDYRSSSETVAHLLANIQIVGALFAFLFLSIWNGVNSSILNALGQYGSQGTWCLLIACVGLASAWLSPEGWGVLGVVWVVNIGFLFRCGLLSIEVSRKTEAKVS